MDSSSDSKSMFGSHPRASFDQKSWKIIQTKLSKLSLASRQNKLFPECLQYLQLLQDLNPCSKTEDSFGDASIKTFFFNEFIPKTTKNILKCNTMNNGKMTEILKYCLHQVILLWIKTLLEDHTELTKAVEKVLTVAHSCYGCTEVPSTVINPGMNNNNLPEPEPQTVARPTLFGDFIERFRKEKSLDHIYELVNNTKTWSQSIRMMTLVCLAVGNLSLLFPKDLAIRCMSKVREAIKERLVHNLEAHIESFKEENPMPLLRAYNLLLKRLSVPSQEKHREIDLLRLHICSTCFKSSIFYARVVGLRILNQTLADFKRPHLAQLKALSKSECDQVLLKMFGEVFCDEVKWKPHLFPLHLLGYVIQQNLLTSKTCKALKIALTLFNNNTDHMLNKIIGNVQDAGSYMVLLDSLIPSSTSNYDGFDFSLMCILDVILRLSHGSEEIKQKLGNFYDEVLVKKDISADRHLFHCVHGKLQNFFPERRSAEYALSMMNNCIDQLEKDFTRLPLFQKISCIVYDAYLWQEIDMQKVGQIIENRRVMELFKSHLKSFKQQHRPERIQLISIGEKTSRELYLAQMSTRIICLDHILKYSTNKQSLSYDSLSELWEICIEQAFIPAERDLMFELLTSLAEIPSSYECISLNDFEKFLWEKIINNHRKYDLLNSKEGAHCFYSFFVAGNQISGGIRRATDGSETNFMVKVHPKDLKGFDALWNFTLRCEDENAAEEAIDFLVKLYSSLDDKLEADLVTIRKECVARCFEYLNANKEQLNRMKYLRCLRLIGMMMDVSGKNGLGNMHLHTQLARGDKLKVTIEYRYTNHYYVYRRRQETVLRELTITTDSNSPLFEFLKEVSRELKLHWDELQLFKYPNFMPNSKDIPRNYTGRTLSDIGISTDMRMRIYQKYIPRADLLCSDNTFNPRAEKFLIGLFEEYSDNGKMSPEHYRDYQCPDPDDFAMPIDDFYVRDFFESGDLDRKGCLTLDDFLKVNLHICKNNPYSVWSVFQRHRMRNDLKETIEIDNYKANESSLVSYIISSNDIYDKLFSLLDCEESTIPQETWNLLNRMPTNLKVFEEIVLMTGVRGTADPTKRDWNSVLNLNSKYKALYAINIIEYLLLSNHNNEKSVRIEIPKLSEYQKTWEKDFLGHGGLKHLCGIFNLFKLSERAVFASPYKRVFDFSDAIIDKFNAVSEDLDETIKSQISRFAKMASEYQAIYLNMKQNVTSRLVRKAIDKLKRGIFNF